jgi:hypothetical protein
MGLIFGFLDFGSLQVNVRFISGQGAVYFRPRCGLFQAKVQFISGQGEIYFRPWCGLFQVKVRFIAKCNYGLHYYWFLDCSAVE